MGYKCGGVLATRSFGIFWRYNDVRKSKMHPKPANSNDIGGTWKREEETIPTESTGCRNRLFTSLVFRTNGGMGHIGVLWNHFEYTSPKTLQKCLKNLQRKSMMVVILQTVWMLQQSCDIDQETKSVDRNYKFEMIASYAKSSHLIGLKNFRCCRKVNKLLNPAAARFSSL